MAISNSAKALRRARATLRRWSVSARSRMQRRLRSSSLPDDSSGMRACSSGGLQRCSKLCVNISRKHGPCWRPFRNWASGNSLLKWRKSFPRCENISIDYAVLEKANNVVGIAIDDIGWNDVGSWNAVYELLKRDADGNASAGDSIAQDSTGNYVDARGKLVALLGVKDLVIVDTPDALLIADRKRAQEVGAIVKALEQRKRDDLL